MAKSKNKYAPSPREQAKQIVAMWHKQIVASLKPWFLQPKVFREMEPLLRENIRALIEDQHQAFTAADRRHSLRVARDAAKICKILRPKTLAKALKKDGQNIFEVPFDTFEVVLDLCAVQHQVCQGTGGGGGWCDIGG